MDHSHPTIGIIWQTPINTSSYTSFNTPITKVPTPNKNIFNAPHNMTILNLPDVGTVNVLIRSIVDNKKVFTDNRIDDIVILIFEYI